MEETIYIKCKDRGCFQSTLGKPQLYVAIKVAIKDYVAIKLINVILCSNKRLRNCTIVTIFLTRSQQLMITHCSCCSVQHPALFSNAV